MTALHSVRLPVAPLHPDATSPRRDRELVYGNQFEVLDRQEGRVYGRALREGYLGWIDAAAVGPAHTPTHRIAARQSHGYTAPDIKCGAEVPLSLGSELCIVETDLPLAGSSTLCARSACGLYIPQPHLADAPERDPVAVAERLLGTPYLWGGNSAFGIDCSGLVQAALLACGVPCPGDTGPQERAFTEIKARALAHGDLIFWKGHVAFAAGPDQILHATAHGMTVRFEKRQEALDRIAAQGDPVTSYRRWKEPDYVA